MARFERIPLCNGSHQPRGYFGQLPNTHSDCALFCNPASRRRFCPHAHFPWGGSASASKKNSRCDADPAGRLRSPRAPFHPGFVPLLHPQSHSLFYLCLGFARSNFAPVSGVVGLSRPFLGVSPFPPGFHPTPHRNATGAPGALGPSFAPPDLILPGPHPLHPDFISPGFAPKPALPARLHFTRVIARCPRPRPPGQGQRQRPTV